MMLLARASLLVALSLLASACNGASRVRVGAVGEVQPQVVWLRGTIDDEGVYEAS
jgi:hypothetical protein